MKGRQLCIFCHLNSACSALWSAPLRGGALAQTISIWNVDVVRSVTAYLVLCIGGAVGAALAGFVMADAFGQKGPRGAFWSVQAWCVTTILGAWFGAAVFAIEPNANLFLVIKCALEKVAIPSMMFVMRAIVHSPEAFSVWVLGGCAMHRVARLAHQECSGEGLT